MAGKDKGSGEAQTCRGLATEADQVCEGIFEGVPPGQVPDGRAGRSGRDMTSPPLGEVLFDSDRTEVW